MHINDALSHAAAGEAVLFLGAGYSLGATNAQDSQFKTGTELAHLLSALAGAPDQTALEEASEFFADRYGVDELIKRLRREYLAKSIAPYHITIAKLPWKRIYTTNYDNVFETAAIQSGKIVVPINPDSKVHATAKADTLCVHLNGYIDALDRETIWTSFRLTDTSYATAAIETSEWAALFRQDIRFARSVFFIGYSLFDLDIKRILKSTPELIEKTFFILHAAVDPITDARATRYGSVLKCATSGMADMVSAGGFLAPRTFRSASLGRSIKEYVPQPNIRHPTDKDFIDFMMLGEFDRSMFSATDSAPSHYHCQRSVVLRVIEQLDKGKRHAFALHSDIANGKSVTLELIANAASAHGWRVFIASELSEYAAKEVISVAEMPGKTLLLVDDYGDWLEQMEGITSVAGDRFAIVVTARSNTHDLTIDRLEEALSPWPIEELDLNLLVEDETEWWMRTLDLYGLWGERAGSSNEVKLRFLNDTCDRQIQGILLRLLDSPVIARRLADAANAVKLDSTAERMAITVFILAILNQRPTIDTITDILGVGILSNRNVKSNTGVTNFIDLTRHSVRVRSTIAAEYLLNHFWNSEVIVSVLLEIARVSDRFYSVSLKYEALFKTIMRFSSIQQVLPEKGRRDAVISYYENLKVIGRCQRSPLFWLQYAIGALVNGDIIRAKTYFDTSYSLAEKLGWDTFQIDNHYARYLLLRAAQDAPFDEAISLFREARTLINRQIQDDKLHYPFRVASTYQDFFDRFQSQFSEAELSEVAQAAESVANRIGELPEHRVANRHIQRCNDAMQYIMDTAARRIVALKNVP